MSDPRQEPGFKHKRSDDKVQLLLGAILDALKELKAPPAPAPTTARRQKAD